MSSSLVLRSRTSKFSVEEKDETICAEEEDRLILLPNADGTEEENELVVTKEEHMLFHLLGTEENEGNFVAKKEDEAVRVE